LIADALILKLLREPQRARSLALSEWDLLIRQARAANLLARLAWLIESEGLNAQVPPQAAIHLRGARLVAARHRQAVQWEVAQVRRALQGAGLPLILLKGAAYVAAGLPSAHGRLFSDIDVLVPKARINAAEAALMLHGWGSTHHDAYDQRYYREWMHELPPMQHGTRMTVVDVHHAILPETARSKPDSAKLIAAARELPGQPGVKTLAPMDMVIHSACHLFHEEELHHGLRDLVDLDALLRAFGGEPGFWESLPARARTRPGAAAVPCAALCQQAAAYAGAGRHPAPGGCVCAALAAAAAAGCAVWSRAAIAASELRGLRERDCAAPAVRARALAAHAAPALGAAPGAQGFRAGQGRQVALCAVIRARRRRFRLFPSAKAMMHRNCCGFASGSLQRPAYNRHACSMPNRSPARSTHRRA
jgi:hypothetical protein